MSKRIIKNILLALGLLAVVTGFGLLIGCQIYHAFYHPEWTQMQAFWKLKPYEIAGVILLLGGGYTAKECLV